jgi:hypothetical protein
MVLNEDVEAEEPLKGHTLANADAAVAIGMTATPLKRFGAIAYYMYDSMRFVCRELAECWFVFDRNALNSFPMRVLVP